MSQRLSPSLFSLFLSFLVSAAHAHSDSGGEKTADAASEPLITLPGVTVSASALPLDSAMMTTPVTLLEGEELIRRRAASLGETLANEPGITATHFGSAASRPIIRGMDGARVRILSDGSEIMDASMLSPDHAVTIEPLLSRQIEVLRGPSALAYGGGAIGGVVNVLDDRIPDHIPVGGVEAAIEMRGNTAANEAAGLFSLTAGAGSLAVHAEGLKRDMRDYRVGRDWKQGSKVAGSYNQTDTGSLGVSWVGDQGYVGVAYTDQRNEYGLPGHSHAFEGCHVHGDELHCGAHTHAKGENHGHHHHGTSVPYVDMHSERWEARGEWYEPFAGFSRIKLRSSRTHYRHDEIEQHVVSTRFKNKGRDGHLELEHHPLLGWRGAIGLQNSRRDFSAVGAESYVIPTLTEKNALFIVEEYQRGDWRVEAGLRQEWQQIEASGARRDRSHRGVSLSVGALWHFAPQYALALTLSRSQRLPTAEELYADGLHMATATYERGNVTLDAETARNIDLSLRKLAGDTTFAVSVFHNRIADYIYADTLDMHDGLQLIEYAQRDAVFTGIEGQVQRRLGPALAVTLFGDYVRARLHQGAGNRNLPRIPPYRVGARLQADWQSWHGELEWYHSGAQNKTAEFETATSGYSIVNLMLLYERKLLSSHCQFYLKANNLTDKLAYRHSSFIKEAAPLTGRNVVAGLRFQF